MHIWYVMALYHHGYHVLCLFSALFTAAGSRLFVGVEFFVSVSCIFCRIMRGFFDVPRRQQRIPVKAYKLLPAGFNKGLSCKRSILRHKILHQRALHRFFVWVPCDVHLFAIPAATVIIYVSLSLLLSFFLLPGFSLLQSGLAYLLSLTTSATQHALQLIVMLPGACIEGIKISILQLGLIYIAIIAGCLLIQKLHRCLLHRIHLPSDSHRDYSQQECQTSPSD